jgi:hypothetical protein
MSILPEESTVSTRGVSLIVNKIYATTILLENNEVISEKKLEKSGDEGISEKKLEKMWTRVKCTKIFNRKFILADHLKTGETSKTWF